MFSALPGTLSRPIRQCIFGVSLASNIRCAASSGDEYFVCVCREKFFYTKTILGRTLALSPSPPPPPIKPKSKMSSNCGFAGCNQVGNHRHEEQ